MVKPWQATIWVNIGLPTSFISPDIQAVIGLYSIWDSHSRVENNVKMASTLVMVSYKLKL